MQHEIADLTRPGDTCFSATPNPVYAIGNERNPVASAIEREACDTEPARSLVGRVRENRVAEKTHSGCAVHSALTPRWRGGVGNGALNLVGR